jgi:hypothetical protein
MARPRPFRVLGTGNNNAGDDSVRFPSRVLIWMTFFLLVVVAVVALLWQPLLRAFFANPVFNGMILAVLLVGILINIRQVARLRPEIRWIEEFRRGDSRELAPPQRGLMASTAHMLIARRQERLVLTPATMRALLDGIRARLDESRDLSRYVVGLLIFLGLLGTFWGLLDTLSAVGSVIGSLDVGAGDVGTVFGELRSGLEEPLQGMGTAFSSSLFGLAGALVLGFFDLQAGHAQNRFFNDLEEWLAGLTQVGGGAVEGDAAVPSYIQALLEQAVDGMDKLQRVVAQGEDERRAMNARLVSLTAQMATLAEQIHSSQRPFAELPAVMSRLGADAEAAREQTEALVRHLSNIDMGVTALLGDINLQGSRVVEELRGELRLLAKALGRM